MRNKIDLLHPFMKKTDELFFKTIKGFVTVAQEKSFSRAGERIGLSQSAVSHSVKELENHTGVRLLDRTTREVVLTDAGQQLALRLSDCWMN
ncbi:LysR family transcriptional regulator [Escherichia coli]